MKEVRIKGFEDYTVGSDGVVKSYKSGRAKVMSLYKEKTGYLTVWLCRDGIL